MVELATLLVLESEETSEDSSWGLDPLDTDVATGFLETEGILQNSDRERDVRLRSVKAFLLLNQGL